jgi:hypothetical protein
MFKQKSNTGKIRLKESDIQRQICDYLSLQGYFFWRSNNIPVFDKGRFRAMPKYSLKGQPDIFILRNGILTGVEVKRDYHVNKKQQSQLDQEECGLKIKSNGGNYFVVHSLDDFLIEFMGAIE